VSDLVDMIDVFFNGRSTARNAQFKAQQDSVRVEQCFCVGPQNGQPLCPCAMRSVVIKNGRYTLPERDLGPVKP